jgi:hypothetical protein
MDRGARKVEVKPVRLAWFLWAVTLAAVLFLGFSLTGCAEQRFMTKEQDEEMRAACEVGCEVIPSPLWQQILKLLQGTRI